MKLKRIINLLFFIFLLVASVLIIRKHNSTDAIFQKTEGSIFGTSYHIQYKYPQSLKLEIDATLDSLNNSLSMFRPSSTLSLINRGESMETDAFFQRVFLLAQQVADSTDGAFDATVAPLVNAWGFGFERADSVTETMVDSLMKFVGYKKVHLDNSSVLKSDPRLMLDFGAIAKGYAVDVVAHLLQSKDIKNYMVEIGGEVVLKGCNPEGKTWRIGVSSPTENEQGEAVQTILQLSDVALATSGNYRNFYYKGSQKFAHTINPHTGYPVSHSLLSATVLASSCAEADAYATAFMVMGLDRAKDFVLSHPYLNAYFIFADENGKLQEWMTEGFKGLQQKP